MTEGVAVFFFSNAVLCYMKVQRGSGFEMLFLFFVSFFCYLANAITDKVIIFILLTIIKMKNALLTVC